MVDTVIDLSDYERRMHGAMDVLEKEYQGLRTGRASTNLLDHVQVDVYGSKMPISQVGSVSAPEARLLTVQVWDAGNVKAVEKGIANAGLGLNPQPSGSLIRIPLPELSEERRLEIVKIAGKYAEQSRISVRNVRRDAMDEAKKAKASNGLSEDQLKRAEDEVQKLTDTWVKKIDDALSRKEQDIKKV